MARMLAKPRWAKAIHLNRRAARPPGRHDVLVTPFFDPSRCPSCLAGLPSQPLRCPVCGVDLTGPTVTELVTTLRRADSLVMRMRADMAAAVAPQRQAPVTAPAGAPVIAPPVVPPQVLADVTPTRSWFAGTSVGVILLILGALCVLAAGAVFIAVEWMLLPLVVRALILIAITASFGFFAELALRRGLQATAEAMAIIACGMFVLDLAAARRAGLPGLADLATAPYEILAGVLLAAAASAAAFTVRSQTRWLWSLDAAVAVGMARAAFGALRLSSDEHAVSSVAVAVVASLLYVACRRVRLPIAMWSALGLGGAAWLAAVAVGAERAADYIGGDVGRVAASWPALTVAFLAGLWSIRLTHAVWRRGAAGLCLMPVLLIFEIVGWSHGWVVGCSVMLAGYVIAVLASARVPHAWSSAVGGSALVLALSVVVGLLPTVVVLVSRTGLAVIGSWREPRALPFDLVSGDVGPWLLPLTTLVILALLPRINLGGRRLSVDQHDTAGLVVPALGVLPMLYGAGFWVSMTALVIAAATLFGAARLWRNDFLLLFAWSPLVIMRICAYYDDLADPLAWTLIAATALAWALTERRQLVRAGFLTAGGLFALAGVAQWLTFTQVPRPFHGLVIVSIGSLGLLASQGLLGSQGLSTSQKLRATALARAVGEGLSVTWVLVGLAVADSSPSHRALELTVAGVAAGITAYLSDDRRRAGWVSGVLLTVASWIRLADSNVEAVEWYTLPAATALLVYGVRRLRLHPGESTWRCLGSGLALALTPSLLLALDAPVTWRGLIVGLASVVLVAVGVWLRLAAPFALGVVATGLLALRNIWPVAAFIPRWSLLFIVGGVLLWAGMTWELRVNDARTASRYVRGLR